MSRSLASNFVTELNASVIRPISLVEVFFDGGPINVWSGVGDLSWDSKTWLGAGDLLSINAVTETTTITPTSIAIHLGGIKSSYIFLVLLNARQGKSVKVWLAFMDASENLIVDAGPPENPYLMFHGRVDTFEIEEGAENAIITLVAQNRLVDLLRARDRRYTPEDQKTDFPSDRGLETVHAAAVWTGTWGRK